MVLNRVILGPSKTQRGPQEERGSREGWGTRAKRRGIGQRRDCLVVEGGLWRLC